MKSVKSGSVQLCGLMSGLHQPNPEGGESIWRFYGARPHSTPGENSKDPARSDYADWCLVSSYNVSSQSDKKHRLKIDLNISLHALQCLLMGIKRYVYKRLCGLISSITLLSFSVSIRYEMQAVNRLETFKGHAPTAPPGGKLKNPAWHDCADWCPVSSYQVSAQSADKCKLWINLKTSRSAPPRALWGKSKNSAAVNCADWYILSSDQILSQSANYCSLWIH